MIGRLGTTLVAGAIALIAQAGHAGAQALSHPQAVKQISKAPTIAAKLAQQGFIPKGVVSLDIATKPLAQLEKDAVNLCSGNKPRFELPPYGMKVEFMSSTKGYKDDAFKGIPVPTSSTAEVKETKAVLTGIEGDKGQAKLTYQCHYKLDEKAVREAYGAYRDQICETYNTLPKTVPGSTLPERFAAFCRGK